MESSDHRRGMVCAAFAEARGLEETYEDLLHAGLSASDVSVLVTEDAIDTMEIVGDESVLRHIAPMYGGFTGGIRVRALGPARSFGFSGSVASGLMGTGIDDAEAAWLMNALADGRGLILVHGHGAAELELADQVFAENGAERFVPAPALNAAASAVRTRDMPPLRPD